MEERGSVDKVTLTIKGGAFLIRNSRQAFTLHEDGGIHLKKHKMVEGVHVATVAPMTASVMNYLETAELLDCVMLRSHKLDGTSYLLMNAVIECSTISLKYELYQLIVVQFNPTLGLTRDIFRKNWLKIKCYDNRYF